MYKFNFIIKFIISHIFYLISYLKYIVFLKKINRLNLCSGNTTIKGYVNIDVYGVKNVDFIINLAKQKLFFASNTIDSLICMSAINYFDYQKGQEIISEVYRIMKPGGIVRFSCQDLDLLTVKFINRDKNFFFEALPNGEQRYPGNTIADKYVQWFYGHQTLGGNTKYAYNYESLAFLFRNAGFKKIFKKKFKESLILDIDKIDNRPEQSFFLEAIK